MYGIIVFNKGEKAPSTEFRAEAGRYGRGSACKECRISRVRCSGTLDGENCSRCKRLAKPCLYPSKRTHHRNRNSHKKTAPTRAASPEQGVSESCASGSSSSSPPDMGSSDEGQFFADDQLELDFEKWDPLHNAPPLAEPLQPCIDLMLTPPITEFSDSLGLPPLQPEGSQKDSTVSDFFGNRELATAHPFPDLQDTISDTRGPACQCTCLQAMMSSLSSLRCWDRSGRLGVNPGTRTDGVPLSHARVEDFLALFEKSMAQLQVVESCSLVCILSQGLIILLLLVIEQLAKLLLILAADSTGQAGGSSSDVLSRPATSALGIQEAASNVIQKGQDGRLARIGTFETMDPIDLQMITRLLLHIRIQALDAFIGRWSDKIRHCGFENLEADLEKIREDLSSAVFLENIKK
ncbi:hypothetical protein GGR52DRAFT_573677 [Hypoxylon sp. FL1284]|nr:hypothetical protein GGR52DRAFT_573677 [Hypoxylon sp. FL1284]